MSFLVGISSIYHDIACTSFLSRRDMGSFRPTFLPARTKGCSGTFSSSATAWGSSKSSRAGAVRMFKAHFSWRLHLLINRLHIFFLADLDFEQYPYHFIFDMLQQTGEHFE